MEIIFLSISCIANSLAIIILLVLHIRENRWGKGSFIDDLRRAAVLHRYYESVVNAENPFNVFNHYKTGNDD